jgi:hypothetical protein
VPLQQIPPFLPKTTWASSLVACTPWFEVSNIHSARHMANYTIDQWASPWNRNPPIDKNSL